MVDETNRTDTFAPAGVADWRSDEWVDDDGSVYELRFRLGRVQGRTTLTGLTISADGDRSAVTTKTVRRLPLGQKIKEWVAREESHADWVAEDIRLDPFELIPPAYAERIRRRVNELTKQHEGPKADSSSTLTFANFARIGAVYLASYRMGFSPTQFVADDQGISFNASTKRILKAREFGFLPPPEAGRPSVIWHDLED